MFQGGIAHKSLKGGTMKTGTLCPSPAHSRCLEYLAKYSFDMYVK